MVRESRHLKISNVPPDATVARLQDLFKRYGRVQKVEILRDHVAIVSFMDLKSATKAADGPNELDKRLLTATYYEPSAMSGSSAVIEIHETAKSLAPPARYGAPSTPQGNDYTNIGVGCDREPSYSRSINRQPTDDRQQLQRRYPPASNKYCSSGANRSGGIGPPPNNGNNVAVSRQPWRDERVSQGGFNGRYGEPDGTGRQQGNESRSSMGQSRGPRRDRSVSPSGSRPTPHTPSPSRSHSHSGSENGCSVDRKSGDRRATSRGGSAMGGEAKPAIIVKNLPLRAADHSIKDGLFHKYKKHGKVVFVKVVGEGDNRYACVAFRRLADVEKMMQNAKDEMFLGSKIQVSMAPPGLDIADDNEKMPLVKDYDEYHPQSSRTLYIGNLENRVNENVLRDLFSQFGEIFDVDIKNRETPAPFAFIQFSDISAVVRAIHKMDSEYMGKNKLKLGFGKTLPTHVVWMDGIAEFMTTSVLARKMSFHGTVTDVFIDHELGQALVHYEFIESAQKAVADMKGRQVGGRKVQIDYASRELQDVFIERLDARNRQYIPKVDYQLDSTEALPRSNDYDMLDPYYQSVDPMYTNGGRGGGKHPYRRPNVEQRPPPPPPRNSYDARGQFDSTYSNSKYSDSGVNNSHFERRSSGERYPVVGNGGGDRDRGYRNPPSDLRRSASPSAHYKTRYRNNSRSPNRFPKTDRVGGHEHMSRRRSLSRDERDDIKLRPAADSRHSSRLSGSRRSKSQSPPSNRSRSPQTILSRRFSGRSGNATERNSVKTPSEAGDVSKSSGEATPNRKFQAHRSSGGSRKNSASRRRSTSSSSSGGSSKGRSSRGTDLTPKTEKPSAPRPMSPLNSPPTSARSSSSSSSSSSSRSSTRSERSRSSSSSSRTVSPTLSETRKKTVGQLTSINSKLIAAGEKPAGLSLTEDITDVVPKEELSRLQRERDHLMQMLAVLDEDGDEQKSPSNGAAGRKPKLTEVFDLSWNAKMVSKKLGVLAKAPEGKTAELSSSTPLGIVDSNTPVDKKSQSPPPSENTNSVSEAPKPVPAPVVSARYSTTSVSSFAVKPEVLDHPPVPEVAVDKKVVIKLEEQLVPEKSEERVVVIPAHPTTPIKVSSQQIDAKPVGHTLTKSTSSDSETTAVPQKPIVSIQRASGAKNASIPEIPLEQTVSSSLLLDPRKQTFEPLRLIDLPMLKFTQGRPKPPPLKLDTPKRPKEPLLSPMGSGGSPARTPDPLHRKCSDPDGLMSDPENLQTPTSAAFNDGSIAGRHSAGSNDLFAMSPPSPGRPSLEERIKALDEKFVILEKAVKAVKKEPAGTTKPGLTTSATGSVPNQIASAAAAIAAAANVDYKRYTIKKKAGGVNPIWEPPTPHSAPVGSMLKSSIFDQDTQRLSSIEEKYTPGTYQRPPEPQESELISTVGRLYAPLTLTIPPPLAGSSAPSPHNFYDSHDAGQRRMSDTPLLSGRPMPKPITPGSAAPHGILKNPITPTTGAMGSSFPFPIGDPRLMISPPLVLPCDPRIAARLKSPGSDPSLNTLATPVMTTKPPMPYDIVKPSTAPITPVLPVRFPVAPTTPSATPIRFPTQKPETTSAYNKPLGTNGTTPRTEKSFGHTGNRPTPAGVAGKVPGKTSMSGKPDGKDSKSRDIDELFKTSDVVERKVTEKPRDGDLAKKLSTGVAQKPTKKPEDSGKDSNAAKTTEGVKKLQKLSEKRPDQSSDRAKEKMKLEKSNPTPMTAIKKRPEMAGKSDSDKKKSPRDPKSLSTGKSTTTSSSSKTKVVQKTKLKKSHSKEVSDSDSEESSSGSDSESDEERRMAKNVNSKEWQDVLAALGDEPVGLSMYDRVKRRSSTMRVGPSKSPAEMKDKFSKLKEKRQSSKQHSEDSNGSRKLKNVMLEDDSSDDYANAANQSVSGQSSSGSEAEDESHAVAKPSVTAELPCDREKLKVHEIYTSDEEEKDEKEAKPKPKEPKAKLSTQLSAEGVKPKKEEKEKRVEKSSSDKNVDKTVVKSRKRNLSGDDRTEVKSSKPAKDGDEEPPKKQMKSDEGQMHRKRGRPPKNSATTPSLPGEKKERPKGAVEGSGKPSKDKLKEKQKKLEKHKRRLKEEKEGGKKRKRDESAEGEKKAKKPRREMNDSDDQPASPILTKAAKKLVEVKPPFITKGAMKEMSLTTSNQPRSTLTSPRSENGSVDHQFGVDFDADHVVETEAACPVEVTVAEVITDDNAIILPDGSADVIMTVAAPLHQETEETPPVNEDMLAEPSATEVTESRETLVANDRFTAVESYPTTAESAVESLVKNELLEEEAMVKPSPVELIPLATPQKEEPPVETCVRPPTAVQLNEARYLDQMVTLHEGQPSHHPEPVGRGILPSHVDKVIDDVVHGYIEMDPDELIKLSKQRQQAQQLSSVPVTVRKASSDSNAGESSSRQPPSVPTSVAALPSSLQSSQPPATPTSSALRELTESLVSSTDFATHLTTVASGFMPFAQPPLEGLLAAQQQQQHQDYIRHLQQQQQQQPMLLPQPNPRLATSTYDLMSLQQQAKQTPPVDVKSASNPFAALSAAVTSAGNFSPFGVPNPTPLRLPGSSNNVPTAQTPTTPTAAASTSSSPSAALQSLDLRAFLELQQKRTDLQNVGMWANQAALFAAQQQAAFRNNPAATSAAIASLAEQEMKLQVQREQQRLLAVDQQQRQQLNSRANPTVSQPAAVRTAGQPQPPQTQPEVTPNTFRSLVQRYPIVWQGHLALKNDQALVQMHFVSGNSQLPPLSLPVPPPNEIAGTPILRIAQRMRLEAQQLDGVARRMQMAEDHCLLLALPCGRDQNDIFLQSSLLQTGFITYLQQKQAAGIVNVSHGNDPQPAYVVHIFPPCDFARKHFVSVADDFHRSIQERQTPYLLIVIATVS